MDPKLEIYLLTTTGKEAIFDQKSLSKPVLISLYETLKGYTGRERSAGHPSRPGAYLH